MFYDIRITATQAASAGEWVYLDPEDDPSHIELAVIDNHLVAHQGDCYAAWDIAGVAVDDSELDRLLELGRQPRPAAATADVETAVRMRRELGDVAETADDRHPYDPNT